MKENFEKNEKQEDIHMEQKLEEILNDLDYNEFPIWKKNEINGLLLDIKKAKRKEEKEKIFFELIDLIDN